MSENKCKICGKPISFSEKDDEKDLFCNCDNDITKFTSLPKEKTIDTEKVDETYMMDSDSNMYETKLPQSDDSGTYIYNSKEKKQDDMVSDSTSDFDTSDYNNIKDLKVGTEISGQKFGNYELIMLIGKGGMGNVYKARQQGLDRDVAIKTMISGEAASKEMIERFQIEAKAAGQLKHPNIVQVYDVGKINSLHYFAMDFVDGPSLKDIITDKKLSVKEAFDLIIKVSEAIHYAHGKNIIHRDIKPHNIMIDPSGEPQIADFGLAKNLTEEGQTVSGQAMGTPQYMPPEQALGELNNIGPWTDVYSLGAVLYEIFAGDPPFTGTSAMMIMYKVCNEEVVGIRKIRPDLPVEVETIIMKCLEKDINRRYHSAKELADDCRAFLEKRPISAQPASFFYKTRKRIARNKLLSSVIAFSLVVSMGLTVWALSEAKRAIKGEHNALLEKENANKAADMEKLARKQADDARVEVEKALKELKQKKEELEVEKKAVEDAKNLAEIAAKEEAKARKEAENARIVAENALKELQQKKEELVVSEEINKIIAQLRISDKSEYMKGVHDLLKLENDKQVVKQVCAVWAKEKKPIYLPGYIKYFSELKSAENREYFTQFIINDAPYNNVRSYIQISYYWELQKWHHDLFVKMYIKSNSKELKELAKYFLINHFINSESIQISDINNNGKKVSVRRSDYTIWCK